MVGIRDWRQLLCADHESSFLNECQQNMGGTEGFAREIESNPLLRLAFMDDKSIIVTPCKIPPSPFNLFSWAKEKLMKNKLFLQQNTDQIDDVNEGEQEESNSKLTDEHASNSVSIHQQELTSPCSLFSPIEQKFTLDEVRNQLQDSFGMEVKSKERYPSTPSGQLLRCIVSAPQHSTPIIADNKIKPSQLPLLTPIIVGASDKSAGERAESCPTLPGVVTTQTRRQLIPSQLKVFLCTVNNLSSRVVTLVSLFSLFFISLLPLIFD